MTSKALDISKFLCFEKAIIIFNNYWLDKENGKFIKKMFEAIFDLEQWELQLVEIL
jgi:hypothetical protein